MKTVRPAAAHLKGLEPYDPKYLPARIYLNANENPYGMPMQTKEALIHSLENEPLHRYPDPLAKRLRARIARELQVPDACVLLGNGGDELLFDLCLAFGGKGRKLLTAPPTFSVYHTDAALTHTEVVEIARTEQASAEGLMQLLPNEEAILSCAREGGIDLIMLTSPNNPTGDCLTRSFIERLLAATDAVVLIDHAYIEFSRPEYDSTALLKEHANLAILRTFSKAYALAGMRIGYLVASEVITRELCKVRQPYSVDALAALAALAALDGAEEREERIATLVCERERLASALGKAGLGLDVFSSEANYILFRMRKAQAVWQRLYDEYGILVRDLSCTPGLEDCLRVSIGTPEENSEFLQALSQLVDSPAQ